MMSYKKIIKYGLLLLGVFILILFIKNINFKVILLSIQALGVYKILVLVGLTILNILVKAIRWKLIIRKITNNSISLFFSFISIIAGVAGGSIVPGRIELAKPFMLKTNYNIRLSSSLAGLSIERILDLFTLLLFAIVSLLFITKQNFISPILIIILTIILVLVTAIVTLFPKFFIQIVNKVLYFFPFSLRIKERLSESIESLLSGFSILKEKLFVVFMTILSIIANGIEVVRLYVLLYFLSIDVSIALVGFAFAVAIIIGVLTTIPGGIGITEFSTATILATSLTTIPESLIKVIVLIDRFIAYYLLIFSGAVILMVYDFIGKKLSKSPS